jgi:gas vesicle protein
MSSHVTRDKYDALKAKAEKWRALAELKDTNVSSQIKEIEDKYKDQIRELKYDHREQLSDLKNELRLKDGEIQTEKRSAQETVKYWRDMYEQEARKK